MFNSYCGPIVTEIGCFLTQLDYCISAAGSSIGGLEVKIEKWCLRNALLLSSRESFTALSSFMENQFFWKFTVESERALGFTYVSFIICMCITDSFVTCCRCSWSFCWPNQVIAGTHEPTLLCPSISDISNCAFLSTENWWSSQFAPNGVMDGSLSETQQMEEKLLKLNSNCFSFCRINFQLVVFSIIILCWL